MTGRLLRKRNCFSFVEETKDEEKEGGDVVEEDAVGSVLYPFTLRE